MRSAETYPKLKQLPVHLSLSIFNEMLYFTSVHIWSMWYADQINLKANLGLIHKICANFTLPSGLELVRAAPIAPFFLGNNSLISVV